MVSGRDASCHASRVDASKRRPCRERHRGWSALWAPRRVPEPWLLPSHGEGEGEECMASTPGVAAALEDKICIARGSVSFPVFLLYSQYPLASRCTPHSFHSSPFSPPSLACTARPSLTAKYSLMALP